MPLILKHHYVLLLSQYIMLFWITASSFKLEDHTIIELFDLHHTFPLRAQQSCEVGWADEQPKVTE